MRSDDDKHDLGRFVSENDDIIFTPPGQDDSKEDSPSKDEEK